MEDGCCWWVCTVVLVFKLRGTVYREGKDVFLQRKLKGLEGLKLRKKNSKGLKRVD